MSKELKSVNISASASVSGEINISGALPVGLYIDPGMTSTTLTFEVSRSTGGTYSLISDGAGNSYTKTIRAGDYLPLDPSTFAGASFLKIIGGSTETSQCVLTLVILTNE